MSPGRALSVQANAPLVVDCLKCRFGVTWEQSQQKWQPHYAVVITQRADSGILCRLHSCIKWEKKEVVFPIMLGKRNMMHTYIGVPAPSKN